MKPLKELAALVGGTVTRDGDLSITGVNTLDDARAGEISFVANPKYLPRLASTRASAVVCGTDVASKSPVPAIAVADPAFAFLKIAECFTPPEPLPSPGIHPTAFVHERASVSKDASVGPCCVVEAGATIGARTILHAQVFVGREAIVGADCRLHAQSTLRERCVLGDRVILQPGAVIGSDGFGYVTINGVHHKIPQSGIVVLEDDVEVGANTAIDRARLGQTLIKRGVKIDNLVQVAHNVVVGEGSLLVAQVGISGSTKLGRYVILAGQAGVAGHLDVPDGTVLTAQSGLGFSGAKGDVLSGSPARPRMQHERSLVALYRLPELLKEIKLLRQRVDELENGR
jgi:UDP-3-O-[3-hydroxymyristoyl] glucosamine N-acyltransferase